MLIIKVLQNVLTLRVRVLIKVSWIKILYLCQKCGEHLKNSDEPTRRILQFFAFFRTLFARKSVQIQTHCLKVKGNPPRVQKYEKMTSLKNLGLTSSIIYDSVSYLEESTVIKFTEKWTNAAYSMSKSYMPFMNASSQHTEKLLFPLSWKGSMFYLFKT